MFGRTHSFSRIPCQEFFRAHERREVKREGSGGSGQGVDEGYYEGNELTRRTKLYFQLSRLEC